MISWLSSFHMLVAQAQTRDRGSTEACKAGERQEQSITPSRLPLPPPPLLGQGGRTSRRTASTSSYPPSLPDDVATDTTSIEGHYSFHHGSTDDLSELLNMRDADASMVLNQSHPW